MLEVAPRDLLALGVRRQPALAVTQQLLHLGVIDPVMLVVIEDGHEDVEVAEQLVQRSRGAEADTVIGALAPLGELFVERMSLGCHLVAEWLEQPAQEAFPTAAGQDGQPRLQRQLCLGQLGPLLAAP